MVQVDVFWSHAIGAGRLAAAFRIGPAAERHPLPAATTARTALSACQVVTVMTAGSKP